MIENERRPDEFIELKIEKETRFEKLKREFENN